MKITTRQSKEPLILSLHHGYQTKQMVSVLGGFLLNVGWTVLCTRSWAFTRAPHISVLHLEAPSQTTPNSLRSSEAGNPRRNVLLCRVPFPSSSWWIPTLSSRSCLSISSVQLCPDSHSFPSCVTTAPRTSVQWCLLCFLYVSSSLLNRELFQVIVHWFQCCISIIKCNDWR